VYDYHSIEHKGTAACILELCILECEWSASSHNQLYSQKGGTDMSSVSLYFSSMSYFFYKNYFARSGNCYLFYSQQVRTIT